jgi:hypothetical protein
MALARPTPYSWSVGDTISATLLNGIRDALLWGQNPPNFLGIQSVVQSVASGTWAAVSLDTASFDSYSGHSNTTNNSRYVCQAGAAGYYIAAGVVGYANSSAGAREAALAVNGSRLSGTAGLIAPSSADGGVVVSATREVLLSVGDYIELHTIQDSGGALNTKVSGEVASAFWLRWSHA